jgi:hypothetical protein
MTHANENARRQPGAVVTIFSPAGTGGKNYTPACTQCGAFSRGYPLCLQCWGWTLSAQNTRAAAALLRGLR